jgi:hypothetical protein
LNNSYLETWQGSGNHPESETASSLPASSLEPHYSVQVLAELWRLDESTIRRIFEAAPGVLRLGNDKRRSGKREYFTLRIPASVAEREYQRRIVEELLRRATGIEVSLPDLYLGRLHSRKCPHRKKGRQFLNCKCCLGVDGTLKGRRYRRSLNTRSLDKAYRKLAAIERPDYPEPKPIQDAIEAFKSSKEDVGHGTKRNHRRALDNFLRIAKSAGITRLDDVEIETVDLFRTKRPISAMTWIKELAILRNFFGFCVSRKWMCSNPAKEVKPPTVKTKPKEPYTQEEVVRILSGL